MATLWKPEACGQTVLPDPDRSVLVRQKLVENAKIQNSNATLIFKQCEWCAQIKIRVVDLLFSDILAFAEKCIVHYGSLL